MIQKITSEEREKEVIMTLTGKLGLVLPDEKETYNINVINENFRIVDENIGGAEILADLRTKEKASLVGAINEVLQKIDTNVDTLSNAIKGVVADVNLLEQGLQSANANISTGLQSANTNIAAVNTSVKNANADIATIRTSLQTATSDIASIKTTLQNVTAKLGNLVQIKVLVSEEYQGHTVVCTNGIDTQRKVVDSSLTVTFDVTLGEWTITLDNLEENVGVYYYGIHNVDMTVEPDSVELITIHSDYSGGTGIVSASSEYSTNSLAYLAVDGENSTNGWGSKTGYPQWWQYQFNSPKVVKKFKFSSMNGEAVKTFRLQASNDGIEWVDLGVYTNAVTTEYVYIEHKTKNRTEYTYYRIYFVEGYKNFLSIAQIQFYGY